MPKEIAPPDPIPVNEEPVCLSNNFNMSFMQCQDNAFSDQSSAILEYLESEYDNTGVGDTRSFIARNTTCNSVYAKLLNAGLPGIDIRSFSKHLNLTQYRDDVVIFVFLY